MSKEFEEFMSRMSPAAAKKIKVAQETETIKYPTASLSINKATNGGIAEGRMHLWYGGYSAGKSAVSLQSIGEWQKQGLICAFVDVEGTYDKDWAEKLGVNNDELILIQNVKTSGKVEKELIPLLDAEIDVVVVDSISDILEEIFVNDEGQINDQTNRKQIGSHAKAIKALLTGLHYANKRTAFIIISQETTNINATYVEFVWEGGKKAGHAATQILHFKSSASPNSQIYEKVEENGVMVSRPVARDVTVLVKKNKIGQPFLTGGYRFNYGVAPYGVDKFSEMVDMALEYNLATSAGAWVYYGEDKFNGKKKFTESVREDVDLQERLQADLEALWQT